jgi:hypothetical protein
MLLDEIPYREDPDDKDSPLWMCGMRWVGRMRGTAQLWTRSPRSKRPIAGDLVVSSFQDIGDWLFNFQ